MKIKTANVCALTNSEVLDFLASRGASKDPTQVIVTVYDYLVETAACNQTRKQINELLGKCKKFDFAKAKVLNAINLRPSSLVEIDLITEHSERRFGEQLEELENLMAVVLPVAPTRQKPVEGSDEDKEEMAEGTKREDEE